MPSGHAIHVTGSLSRCQGAEAEKCRHKKTERRWMGRSIKEGGGEGRRRRRTCGKEVSSFFLPDERSRCLFSVCQCLSVSFSLSLSLSVSACMSLSVCLSLSACFFLCLSVCLCMSIPVCLFLCLSVSM